MDPAACHAMVGEGAVSCQVAVRQCRRVVPCLAAALHRAGRNNTDGLAVRSLRAVWLAACRCVCVLICSSLCALRGIRFECRRSKRDVAIIRGSGVGCFSPRRLWRGYQYAHARQAGPLQGANSVVLYCPY